MYFDDHDPPHFHAEYAEDQAVIGIDTLALIAGRLPPRALGLVAEWAAMRQDELRQAWSKAKDLRAINKIAPLP